MNNPAEDALESALTLLKHDWVHEFIFSDDHALYIDELKCALTHSEGMLAELKVAARPSMDPTTHLFNIDEEYHLLFLPTYTSGSITVGIEVFEHFKVSNKFANLPYYRSRFVRDDQKGVLLSIAEHTALGLTDVTFGSFLSPGRRNHVIAQFRSAPFRRAMSSISSGYDKEAIKRALTYSFCSSEIRPCPSCAAVDPDSCACKLSFKRKVHPRDHECDIVNTMQYGGVFQGLANLSLYSDGHSLFNTTYASSSFGRLIFDSNLQNHLSTWAMQDALERDTLNILKMTLPVNPDGALDAPAPTDTGGKGDFSLIKERAFSDRRPSRACIMPNDDSLVADMQNHFAHVLHTPVCEDNNIFDVFDDMVQESTEAAGTVSDTTSSLQSVVETARGEVSPGTEPAACITYTLDGRSPTSVRKAESVKRQSVARQSQCSFIQGQERSSGQDETNAEEMETLLDSSYVELADDRPGEATVQSQEMSVSRLGAGSRNVEPTTKRIPVRLRPACKNIDDMGISERSGFVDERARRIELRKAKNRESARRSSLKKSMQFKKLQSDLEAAKQEEASLRKTEKALREDNLSLRSALRGGDGLQAG